MSIFDKLTEGASNLFHSATDNLWGGQIAASPAPASEEHPLTATAGVGEQIHRQLSAAEQLRGRFKIDDDPTHAHANNVVTSKDFEAIVKLYGDIGAGATDLKIHHDFADPRALAEFRRGAMNDIADILQTSSGRELIQSLAHNPDGRGGSHVTTIGFTENPTDADTDMASRSPLLRYKPGSEATNGLNVPGQEHNTDFHLRSDVTLYHEMVHALHATHGTADPQTADNLEKEEAADHGHWARPLLAGEEYKTVGLGKHWLKGPSENVYRMERMAIGAANVHERAGDDDMELRLAYNPLSTEK